jgi:putative transposase
VKRSKFTEQQIAFALNRLSLAHRLKRSTGRWASAMPRFYNWEKKYGGLGPSDLRHLRQLEEKNSKLKGLVADPAVHAVVGISGLA